MWNNTKATKILGIDYPIMQGSFWRVAFHYLNWLLPYPTPADLVVTGLTH